MLPSHPIAGDDWGALTIVVAVVGRTCGTGVAHLEVFSAVKEAALVGMWRRNARGRQTVRHAQPNC